MADALLEAVDVSFAYDPRGPAVVDGVSLAVSRGAIVGLIGPNGSGKTTVLRLLSGTLTPAHGTVRLADLSMGSLSRRELARRIAVVPQETHSAFEFSALEIVMMGRYPHLGPFELEGADDLAIARDALTATGTRALESRPFTTLSGGEKQRVAIARSLAGSPSVILADEPTAALDSENGKGVMALLSEVAKDKGRGILVVTHDHRTLSYADRLIRIEDGRIVGRARRRNKAAQGAVAA